MTLQMLANLSEYNENLDKMMKLYNTLNKKYNEAVQTTVAKTTETILSKFQIDVGDIEIAKVNDDILKTISLVSENMKREKEDKAPF
jgi:hypothetical protein